MAKDPKEFWLVEKAKHNGALTVAGAAYGQRLTAFFDAYLAESAAEVGVETELSRAGELVATT